MIVYPAIDLKDGVCVRLLKGDMDQATIFNARPAEQAREFENAGFQWLHLVDLNGALEGRSINTDAVMAVIEAVNIPIQLGGGIRSMGVLENWLIAGVNRGHLCEA